MPRAGPLKQILRTLNTRQLSQVRNEFCPQVSKYSGNKTEFVNRIRESLKRSMESNETSYEELMSFTKSLLESDTRTVRTQISHTLKEMEFTGNGAETTKGINERFLAAEVFQALYHTIDNRSYSILREDYRNGSPPDMIIENSSRTYLIEFKRAANKSGMQGLPAQIRRYKSNTENLRKVFVLIIVEKENDLPEANSKIGEAVKMLEEMNKTEIITKEPEELRYNLR